MKRLLVLGLICAVVAAGQAFLARPSAHAAPAAVFYGNNAGYGPDTLEKFDKTTGAVLQTYTPSGGNGRGVVVVGNVIYSTVVNDSNIYETDATTGAPIGTIPTTLPSMSTLAWDGSHFWTTDYSGTNQGYELDATGNVIKTITFPLATDYMDGMEYFTAATNTLPAGPKLIVNRQDGAYGTNIYDIYDLDGNVLTPAFITASNGTGIGYDGQNFFVSDVNNNVMNVFDGMTGAPVSSLPLGGGSHLIEDVSFDYAVTLAHPPSVDITAPTDGAVSAVNSATDLYANLTDADVSDTHTCSIDWGDGTTTSGVVTESGGSGTCTGSHTFTAAGVYTICVTVTDNTGLSGSDCVMTVVYDPSAGFVTGGGWIDSPAGAYTADPSLTGRANFGFVSKYKKGASVPTGNTEFQFQAGDLNFHSADYQWLVVNQGGTNAQFKGSGTINGSGDYQFMLWAGDGSPDTFRIKIWDTATGDLIYDNGGQAIGGGSIVIHS